MNEQIYLVSFAALPEFTSAELPIKKDYEILKVMEQHPYNKNYCAQLGVQ